MVNKQATGYFNKSQGFCLKCAKPHLLTIGNVPQVTGDMKRIPNKST